MTLPAREASGGPWLTSQSWSGWIHPPTGPVSRSWSSRQYGRGRSCIARRWSRFLSQTGCGPQGTSSMLSPRSATDSVEFSRRSSAFDRPRSPFGSGSASHSPTSEGQRWEVNRTRSVVMTLFRGARGRAHVQLIQFRPLARGEGSSAGSVGEVPPGSGGGEPRGARGSGVRGDGEQRGNGGRGGPAVDGDGPVEDGEQLSGSPPGGGLAGGLAELPAVRGEGVAGRRTCPVKACTPRRRRVCGR